ncbi:MAG: Glu-tRNA(Gln) amidotransferase subunit GatE [Candidatus Hodarchaeales archaeon]|jgi:glutamyl-tRNA(Gln) amidotransferase subunit E
MLNPKNLDYKMLKFSAGLEIHHQLQTKRKLFCYCSPEITSELMKNPEFTFERRFRAVMGEMGDFDAGMLVEVEKGYQVVYHASNKHICTYESDETPPFWPDTEAIEIGIQLSKLFKCTSPVDEYQVNRKQYLDGSITTGFQRTMIVARDGEIELKSGKKVRISNILIEEDAARKIKTEDRARTVFYNLDRLGIPLTEIITNHNDIATPMELTEAAKIIGLNCRISGRVKRGIGTVRQDINISIEGGARVELKGAQNIKMFKKYCDHEICRQDALLNVQKEMLALGLTEDRFDDTFVELYQLFDDLDRETTVFGVSLPLIEQILLKEVQPGKDFGMEIFEKCILISGIQSNELFHSGELQDVSLRRQFQKESLFITKEQDSKIREALSIQTGDAYIACKGPYKRVIKALKIAIKRVKLALNGVPEETRRVLVNGNNEFLRVIHGKERLYPDTDTPPIYIEKERKKEVLSRVNKSFNEYYNFYRMKNLTFAKLSQLIRTNRLFIFEKLVEEVGVSIHAAYHLLHDVPVSLRRKGLNLNSIDEEVYFEIGKHLKNRNISKKLLIEVLTTCSQYKEKTEQINSISKYLHKDITDDDVKTIIKKLKVFPQSHSRNWHIGKALEELEHRYDIRKFLKLMEES